MKKNKLSFLAVFALFGSAFVSLCSCGNNAKSEAVDTDSTVVAEADTVATDSMAPKVSSKSEEVEEVEEPKEPSETIYTYTDAIGHEFQAVLRKDGTATITLLSELEPGSLEEIAFKKAKNGIDGAWEKHGIIVGDGDLKRYYAVHAGKEDLYILDDIAYTSFRAMERRDMDRAYKINSVKTN